MHFPFSTLVLLTLAILGVSADINAEAHADAAQRKKKPDPFAGLTKGKTFTCDAGFWHRCCKGNPSYAADEITLWATGTCDAAHQEHIGHVGRPKMGHPHCYSDREPTCCTAMKPESWSSSTNNSEPLICGPARFAGKN